MVAEDQMPARLDAARGCELRPSAAQERAGVVPPDLDVPGALGPSAGRADDESLHGDDFLREVDGDALQGIEEGRSRSFNATPRGWIHVASEARRDGGIIQRTRLLRVKGRSTTRRLPMAAVRWLEGDAMDAPPGTLAETNAA